MSQSVQTTTKTKNELINELTMLKELCSVCGSQAYLRNYFNDLKNDVEIEILSKQISFSPAQTIIFQRKLIELRQQLIDRIEAFESKINAQERDEQVTASIVTTREKLNSIFSLINENHSQLDEIEESIQCEETNILKHLFQNKTIAFVNVEQLVGESKREMIDFKLIIVRDEFISNKAIKQR